MLPTDLDGAFHSTVYAVRSGEISEARIDESVRKILQMKASVGLDKERFVDLQRVSALTSEPSDMNFAQQVADEAVTLVRNNGNMLPLNTEADLVEHTSALPTNSKAVRGLVVLLLAEALESSNGHAFETAIRVRRPDAKILYFDGRLSNGLVPEVLKAVNSAEHVVIAAYVIHRAAQQVNVNGRSMTYFGLTGPSGRLLHQVLAVAVEKTAVVALGSPYLIESLPQIRTYLCTYAMTTTSEISAVKALFGEIQNHAKLPVTLPGIAPRGFSLPWPSQNHRGGQAPVATP
jgi:beta-N-acetylhexosaminidase